MTGPCVDAFTTERTDVFCNDTSSDSANDIWPGFASEADKAGVGSVFAFPLRGGGDVFGVLELYRLDPIGLDDEQIELATASAAAISMAILAELPVTGDLDAGMLVNAFHRPEVNQASRDDRHPTSCLGRRVAFLGFEPAAYSSGRPIWEIAADVGESADPIRTRW
nr:GAF domain-containing protein [Rhodococcus qingshengii]